MQRVLRQIGHIIPPWVAYRRAGFLRRSLLCFLLLVPVVHATSVVAPSFPELVREADAIYRGRVTSVQAQRVQLADGTGSVIKTFVTFAVERTLKGPEQKDVTLEFLGGTVGGESMIVTGMPKFNLGAREIVFVQNNGRQYCPLVALMHGRYRVLRDDATARDHVARDNGVPLRNTADVQMPMAALPEPMRAASAGNRGLSAENFEASISAEVQRPTLNAHPN